MIANPVMPDLSAKEVAVVGTLLAEFPDELPPHCAKLLDHAPESFDDLRHAAIAVAIKQLQAAGKPVAILTVREQLLATGKLDDAGGILFLESLAAQAVGIGIAEFEAEPVWQAYQLRRTKTVLSEAGTALESAPAHAANIIGATVKTLESLTAHTQDGTSQLLTTRIFRPDIQPPQLRPIYTLAGHPVSTPGNITSINSAIKTGKSAVIGAMAGAAMAGATDRDFLGFHSSNPRNLALLHFDSEQSPDDHWHQVTRALKRAGLSAPPPWFYSYCLTGLGYSRAWQCVIAATRAAADKHGGIHSALIDGVADLVADVNDAGESNSFVAELHDMGIHYDCPIVGVIHFNPGGEKTRGHLGSQLERKAETNLRLDKQDEVTTIWSDKQRRAPVPKGTGPCFKWDDAAGMHLSVESLQTTKDAAARESLLCLAQDVFKDHPAMRYSELQTTVKKLLTVSDRTAERKVAQMRALTVIKPSTLGLYVINTPACTK